MCRKLQQRIISTNFWNRWVIQCSQQTGRGMNIWRIVGKVNCFTQGVCHVNVLKLLVFLVAATNANLKTIYRWWSWRGNSITITRVHTAQWSANLMSTGSNQASVRKLDPSPSPVTLYKADKADQLLPTAGVCLPYCSRSGNWGKWVIEQLFGVDELPTRRKYAVIGS